MRLEYVRKVSKVFSYLEKFLPKPPTNQNKPNQKSAKIEKNDFCLYELYGRNFWRAPEISADLKVLSIFVSKKLVSGNFIHKQKSYINLKKKMKIPIFALFGQNLRKKHFSTFFSNLYNFFVY